MVNGKRFLVLGLAVILVMTGACVNYNVSPTSVALSYGNASVPNPAFINLYWDRNWDINEKAVTQARIDGFVQTLVQSGYFGALQQYEPTKTIQARFVTSSAVNPSCGDPGGKVTAPVTVSPRLGGDIGALVVCEAGVLNLDQQIASGTLSSFVFNIFLPRNTTTDRTSGGCPAGKDLESYHFYTVGKGFSIIAYTVIPTRCYLGGLNHPLIHPFHHPFGVLTTALTHEMVEAITDPVPLRGWVFRGKGNRKLQSGPGTEVADLCKDLPWLVGTNLNGPVPTPSKAFDGGQISAYWSNAVKGCILGFIGQ